MDTPQTLWVCCDMLGRIQINQTKAFTEPARFSRLEQSYGVLTCRNVLEFGRLGLTVGSTAQCSPIRTQSGPWESLQGNSDRGSGEMLTMKNLKQGY